ncbi:uncharacterized protein LOC119730670 [Patiria miniata]|uniref:F5/8 type C domain-containing protein n=1 Tax=Patiria miniata TaxID=46514 RepID=A0A914A837_PATMI|nr:uncharacterized protein LOC119730670 [Patiria miniata]
MRCAALCLRYRRCMSFNFNAITGDCQLNDSTQQINPTSLQYAVHFSYFERSDQGLIQQEITAHTSLSTSTETPFEASSSSPIDTQSPVVTCPQDTYSYTTDVNVSVSVTWIGWPRATDDADGILGVICQDDAMTTVVSGDEYKAGNTTVTCQASDAAGNAGNCAFLISIVGSWCGQSSGSWLQIDMGRLVKLYGLIVQGRALSLFYVSSFYMSYSNDGLEWTDAKTEDNVKRKFVSGSADGDAMVPVQTASQVMICSRFIRVIPKGYTTGGMCLRLELVGCV